MNDNLTLNYTELSDLCSCCDEEEAIEMLHQNKIEEGSEQWDEEKESILSEFGQCRECHENN